MRASAELEAVIGRAGPRAADATYGDGERREGHERQHGEQPRERRQERQRAVH